MKILTRFSAMTRNFFDRGHSFTERGRLKAYIPVDH